MQTVFIFLTANLMISQAVVAAPPKIHQKMIRYAGEVPAYNATQPAESVSATVPDTASSLNPDERIFLSEVRRMASAQIVSASHLLNGAAGDDIRTFANNLLGDHQRLRDTANSLTAKAVQGETNGLQPEGKNSAVINTARQLSGFLLPLNQTLQNMEQALATSGGTLSSQETMELIAESHSALAAFVRNVGPGFQDEMVTDFAEAVLAVAQKQILAAQSISAGW